MKKQDKKTEKIEDKKLQKYYFPLIFLVALFFLSVPIARFFSSDSMPGSEPYYTLRISELLKEKITSYDDLSFSGRTYYLNLNHLMLSRFNNSLFFVMFLPLIFGLVSAFLFYKILEKLKINDEQNLIISLILVSSPGFIYTFTVYNLYFIPITLSLLAFYFVLKEKLIIPSVCLALLPLFNIALAPIALFLIFVYYLRHEKKGFILLSILVPVISLVYYLLVFYPALFPQILSLQKQPFLNFFISDFGSDFGFSAFLILLFVTGFFFSWKDKKEYFPIYTVSLALLIFSYFFPKINLLLNFFIVFFAGLSVYSIINNKWNLDVVKKATILLIVCGLLFSALSYYNRLVKMEPTKEQTKALKLIKDDSNKKEIVFSHYKNGFWIEYFSEKPTMMDEHFYYAPNLENRYNDSRAIFYSRNLNQTRTLFEKYKIRYIYIDQKMKSGLVWEKEEQGLLFLLQNRETFKNIYNSSEIEVWKYLK